jgi:hypothetical protein
MRLSAIFFALLMAPLPAAAQKVVDCQFVSNSPKSDRSGWIYSIEVKKERVSLLLVRPKDQNAEAMDYFPYTEGRSIRPSMTTDGVSGSNAQFSIATIQDDGVVTVDIWTWFADNSPIKVQRITLDCPNAKAIAEKGK